MPRINRLNKSHTMPRKSNIFYALLTKDNSLQSYCTNPEQVLERGADPVIRVTRHTYDSLHASGYFVDIERRIACADLVALSSFCRKLEKGVFFNGNKLTKSRRLSYEEKSETIQDEEDERNRAEQYFSTRGKTSGNTLSDHLEHLLPNSRK